MRKIIFILVDIYKFYLCITLTYYPGFFYPLKKIGMNLDAYPYTVSDDHLIYTFDSYGPNGGIRKVVQYTECSAIGIPYFNLGFGDLNRVTGKIDDRAVSNNFDKEKVLATVAATVVECSRRFPDFPIYVQGSTPSRTRLYQTAISANFREISSLLDVYGYVSGVGWTQYEKNINYFAFLARRK